MPEVRVGGSYPGRPRPRGYHARFLKVEIVENPEAWFDKNKGIHEGVLTATICGRCGFVELYVKNPEELLKVYRQKQSPA
jgi:hypothetical protein